MNQKQDMFEFIANKLGVDPALPEKESFVVQVIKQFAEKWRYSGGLLVFGGGTSLSCGYQAINRFSEDIDFRFFPRPKSTFKVRESLTKFVKNLDGFALIGAPAEDSHRIIFNLDYSKNPAFTKRGTLKEFIKLEIYFSDWLNFQPSVRPITSMHNSFAELPPETEMSCVALEETAADKISALLWRIEPDR